MGIFTVPNKPVSKGYSWILILPITPIWIWAFWRIKSLRRSVPVFLGLIGLSIVLQMFMPFPYGLALVLVAHPAIGIPFHKRWAKQYNKQFENS